jgi:tripartite-type tricarboxylate transporter receptor subunit TctC
MLAAASNRASTSRAAKAVLAALAVVLVGAVANADNYPARPIRILVGSAPGGTADISARLAAEALGRVLKTQVLVEIRGGAGGMNAVDTFLASEPDGYTLLLAAVGSFAIIPAAKHVAYDVSRDFIPLGTVWRSAQVLVVRPGLGVRTLGEFIAAAKARPGALTFGSPGIGTVTHLAMELLEREAGIDLIHVPFRGAGEALPALLSGQIDALFTDPGVLAPRVQAGTVRALAVAAMQRTSVLEDVPTMREVGYPAVTGEIWFGVVASAKTSPAIVKRLQDALVATHGDPTYVQKLRRLNASAGEPGPDALDRLIKSESVKWQGVVRAARIRFD